MLQVSELFAGVNGTPILKGTSISVKPGEVHGVLGPNGCGKSTLARVLVGDPTYTVNSGSVEFEERDLLALSAVERSRLGLFLAFQYPVEVPGVTIGNFLRAAANARRDEEMPALKFYSFLQQKLAELKLDDHWASRYLNEGFSGGEKKRNEILQMLVLEPRLCILDETDSGLDVDALKIVSEGVNRMRSPERSFVIVTHYERLLEYIKPDYCHVMMDGRIVLSEEGVDLAQRIDKHGYDFVREFVQAGSSE